MKKKLCSMMAVLMLLGLAGCGSSSQTDNSTTVSSQETAASEEAEAETAVPETVETADNSQEYEPVAVNEVVYEDNGIRITFVDYRKVAENDLVDGDKALKANFKVEKTADQAEFSTLKMSVNGWLTSDNSEFFLHPAEIPADGKEINLSIRRDVLTRFDITEISDIGVLFAVKTDDYYVYDHFNVPVFSGKQDTALSSTTEGFYQPGVLVNTTNKSNKDLVAYYLVKCKDSDGHQLLKMDMMSGAEWIDGHISHVNIRAGASDMPAAVRISSNNDWEYAGNYFHDYEIADATAELLFVYPYYYDSDVSDQVKVTETKRGGGNDSHLYAYIDWPDDLGKLDVYGTVMRYQNGELKSVVSGSSNNMDPAKEENYLFLECYDHNYENETFETVINAAYQMDK